MFAKYAFFFFLSYSQQMQIMNIYKLCWG